MNRPYLEVGTWLRFYVEDDRVWWSTKAPVTTGWAKWDITPNTKKIASFLRKADTFLDRKKKKNN